MSALDEYLEKRKVDTRATGEVQDGYKVYEVTHDGLYETAAAELLALRERVAKLETMTSELINVLTDGEIEIAREVWGNTNTRLVSERRRALEAALKSQ